MMRLRSGTQPLQACKAPTRSKMKISQKVLNCVLSVVLVLGLMPVSAFATNQASDQAESVAAETLAPEAAQDDTTANAEASAASEATEAQAAEATEAQAAEATEAQAADPTALEASSTEITALALSGSGTEADPYLIATADDLAEFRTAVNAGTAKSSYAKLTDDIELSGQWTPIGTSASAFTGTFDGDGHSITGLAITSASTYSGFFYALETGAVIKNVKLEGTISTSAGYAGGFAASAKGTAFTNCSFSGSVTSTGTSSRVGGFAGSCIGASNTFTSCANKASVTGKNAGGIVGYSNYSNTFTNCYNAGAINTYTGGKAAGIAGQEGKSGLESTYSHCFNVGEISKDGNNYAGIVSFYNGTISDTSSASCYYTLPDESFINAQGTTPIIGTKVDTMVGKASDLGEAFEEGDSYPVLTWENVVTTPKATVTFTTTPADAQITVAGKAAKAQAKYAAGTYSYTVSKQGYTATTGEFTVTEAQAQAAENIAVTVELEAKTLSDIKLSGNAEQYYVGDAWPENSITVTALYTDGTSEAITGYTTDWDSSAEATGKTVTVTYGEKTASFTCNFVVKPGPTSGLAGKADVSLKPASETYGFEEVTLSNETVLASTNQSKGGSSSVMTVTATQPGLLSFMWKVSSESRCDWLDIQVNGKSTTTTKADRSGTIDWTSFSTIVATGDVVTIKYTKDYSGDKNNDTAWLKDFAMAPTYTITASTTPENATFSLKDSAGNVVTGTNNVYTVVAGTYSYEASAFGYETATGNIEVTSENVTKSIVLTALPAYTVSFAIGMPEGLSASDATIQVKSGTQVIASQANGTYNLPAGEYTYTVTHPNCDDVSATFTVSAEALTIDVSLTRKWVVSDYFEAANVAVDAANGTYGFVLDSSDTSVLKSNNQGKSSSSATLTLTAKKAGQLAFSYKVSSESYDKLSITKGSTTLVNAASGAGEWTSFKAIVAENDTIVITYKKDYSGDGNDDTVWLKNFSLESVYNATFTLSPQDASLVVKNADGEEISGTNNVYTAINGTYTYEASKFGYVQASGSITIAGQDVAQTVTLEASPTQTVTFNPVLPEGMTCTPSYTVKSADGIERDYTQGLPAGTYTFVATAEGCDTVESTFTVESEPVTQTVTFVRTLLLTDFVNSDLAALTNDTSNPYVGVYDNDGNYLLSDLTGGYKSATLALKANAKVRVSFDYAVENTASYSSYGFLINKGYTTLKSVQGKQDWTSFTTDLSSGDTLNLKNYNSWGSSSTGSVKVKNFVLTPLYTVTPSVPAGATLTLYNGEEAVTADSSGAYTLPNGTYSYTVSKFGYNDLTGSVTVNGADTTLTVAAADLSRVASKTITFNIPEGASVAVSHATAGQMTAEEDGTFILPVGNTFTYTVSQTNYIARSAQFTVTNDATFTVTLEYAGEAWDGSTKTEPTLTDGVYQISNANELAWFANQISNDNTLNAVLTAQINLNDNAWTSMKGVYNSSTYQYEYAGTFDGAGHTISGLKGTSGGLFAALSSSATVKNLIVAGTVSGSSIVGGIVNTNGGLIENCLFKGSVSNSGTNATGGIAGRCSSSTGIIRNCVNEGTISYTGALSSSSNVNLGGIVGYSYSEISNCYNVGALSAHATNAKAVGGIVGSANASTYSGNCTVSGCYNAGTMSKFASGGAVAGNVTSDATVSNSYYLEGCGATDANAQVKTRAELTEAQFVGILNGTQGTAWHVDTNALVNSGMPILSWQGGEAYVDQDAKDVAAAVEALKLQATVAQETIDLTADTTGTYSLEPTDATALVLPATGAQDTTITWEITAPDTTHESAIAQDGSITYPAAATDTYTLKATIAKGKASTSVSFTVALLSAAQVNENELDVLCQKLQDHTLWAFQVNDPDITTAQQVIENYLTSQDIDLEALGISLAFTGAGTKAYPATEDVNLAADGTISYFQGVENNLSAKYAQYTGVSFTLSRDGVTKPFSIRLFIGWERAHVQDVLNAAAKSVTWETIKPEGVNNQVEYEDANGEEIAGEPVYPFYTIACDGTDIETGEENTSNVNIPSGTTFILPAQVGTTSIEWSADYDEDTAGTLVEFEETYVDGTRMYKATLTGSAYGEFDVALVATYTFNLFNDNEGSTTSYQYTEDPTTHESIPIVDANGDPIVIDVPLVTTYANYVFTLAQGEETPIDSEQTQSDLESKYVDLITDFVDKTIKPTMTQLTDDLQMPTPSTLEKAGIFQNRDLEKVTMTSNDTDHLEFYGYHAKVYRPLPGEEAVTVTYTVTITDRTTGNTYATKDFSVTIQPFTQAELDTAKALMTRVATEDVYWNGIAYEGADKTNITQSLKPFSEITVDTEGNLTYVRGAINVTFGGIQLDEIPGYDPMIYGITWREIRSSNESVIASETLQYTLPAYNTNVTLDSVMSYTKYAKYWEKFGESDTATDDTKAKYAAFKDFYKVPVSTTVTVAGTNGDDTVEPAADVNVTVTVSLAGSLATTVQSEVAAALPVVAKDTNVDGKITYDEAVLAAHKAYAPNGESDFTISSSGWVSKLWGVSTTSLGFLQNGTATPDVISRISVAEGDNLYMYSYIDTSNFTDVVAAFDKTSLNVRMNEPASVTLTYSGYDSNGNAASGAVVNAQLGYATANGFVALENSSTNKNGEATVTFDKPGTYVLTAQSDKRVITAPYCIVNVEYVPTTTYDSTPFASEYVKVKLAGGFDESKTPVANGTSFVKLADGSYAALMTATQAAALTESSITFVDGVAPTVNEKGDVNNSGHVNIVDAQVAYDICAGKYTDFTRLSQACWFTADVNGSSTLEAADAFAIQYALHYGFSSSTGDTTAGA